MEWRTKMVVADLGPLQLHVSNVRDDFWVIYAHLEAEPKVSVCEGVYRPDSGSVRYGSLAEAQAAAHAFVEQLGPVEPWLALFAFFRFDRDRPTARRLATGRATLRKARKRRAA